MTYNEFSQYIDLLIKSFDDNFQLLQNEVNEEYERESRMLYNFIFDIDKSILAHTITILLGFMFSKYSNSFLSINLLKHFLKLGIVYFVLQILRLIIDKCGYNKYIGYYFDLRLERVNYFSDIHSKFHSEIQEKCGNNIEYKNTDIDNNTINDIKKLVNIYRPKLYNFKQSDKLDKKESLILKVIQLAKIFEYSSYFILFYNFYKIYISI